ncbi:bark storage protein A-like [Mercurialis annua]|uniref:bark storage protein A-like n=1 Tax=Mercurialis annua TaxID=3986 RepID=UPI00215E9BD6|nr:bark storage protein A-like [Mercurialis annua]XP_050215304.1 bark storage protein A-like [Mercurialis annua]XP_050215306.1 bark storage protein A-like [Mercurialis annua]XP_050215308.1 bark storage protein A-like [Mercurialis annua]
MAALKLFVIYISALFFFLKQHQAYGAISHRTLKMIDRANMNGPYLGLVIPNMFEMNPLLRSPNFTASTLVIDFSGRRFRFGSIAGKRVILVMTGLGMVNTGITTQLLLSLFNVEGVVHYGTAGAINPLLNGGDVTIPKYWSHTGLWNWQKYGSGPEDELPLESSGDYTRQFGYIKIAKYNANVNGITSNTDGNKDNLLNNVWYQPEEVFPVDGVPEQRQHAFWVPIDPLYFEISKNLKDVPLDRCVNPTTCLSETPKVVTVERGTSANIFLENEAYKTFLYENFHVSAMDMESASVALVCYQQKVPFISIRALCGGKSEQSNHIPEDAFLSLASKNSAAVVVEFIRRLPPSTKTKSFTSY